MKRWLVSLDTDKVKEYVFATGKLREIRGASNLLDSLNREETEKKIKQFNGRAVYCGGGSAMATFASKEKAQEFCTAIETLYPKQTGSATITGVIVAYDDAQKDSFLSAYQIAGRKLRRKKAQGRPPAMILSQPLWHRCQRCGVYPVTATREFDNDQALLLCTVCQTKQQKATWHTGPLARIRANMDAPWPKQAILPQEISKLGEIARPENYIGLIYADGNGIGQIIETYLKTENDFRIFSKMLEDAIMKAVVTAIKPHLTLGSHNILPFLPIIIGGDDVILLAKADVALPIAHQLCLIFQQEMANSIAQLNDQNISFSGEEVEVSMSAGVAIANAKHPVFSLAEMAEELLHSAKRLSQQVKQKKQGQHGCIDFRVVKTPTANPLEKVREKEFQLPQSEGEDPLWGTCRPYPLHRIDKLARPSWEDLQQSVLLLKRKQFPRNKLHQWLHMLWLESRLEAHYNLMGIFSRLSPKDKQTKDDLVNLLYLEPDSPFFMSVFDEIRGGNTYSSPLPDIVEIYDFIWESTYSSTSSN